MTGWTIAGKSKDASYFFTRSLTHSLRLRQTHTSVFVVCLNCATNKVYTQHRYIHFLSLSRSFCPSFSPSFFLSPPLSFFLSPPLFRYRVLAFDHDLLSFMDLKFQQWPAVLITNPKEAQYLHPGVEPLGRIQSSTHIRCPLCVCVCFSTLNPMPWPLTYTTIQNHHHPLCLFYTHIPSISLFHKTITLFTLLSRTELVTHPPQLLGLCWTG